MLRVVRALDVDAPMWGELRGVDKNPRPDRVRFSRQAMNGLYEAGDVRGAADRQQRDPLSVPSEQPVHVVLVQPPLARDRGPDDLCTTPPGQIVGVVLHHRREDDGIRLQGVTEGQLVDRFGGVLPEDDRCGSRVGADKARDRDVRFVVCARAETGFEAGSPMHAGVVRQKALHRIENLAEGRGARRVVEVDVRRQPAVEERQFLVESDDTFAPVRGFAWFAGAVSMVESAAVAFQHHRRTSCFLLRRRSRKPDTLTPALL